ncbi:MAG TPA: alpha-hydroxy acid oxidase [Candidatus Acidoferrum sp.]|nr:alpha-hydroxy acid oxidase [Candidatus Acidoferrum sp.]
MKACSIEDLRAIAQRNVPKAFFQYGDHGSYTQQTLRANHADLQALPLRQRIGIAMGTRDLTTTIAGEPSALPFAFAPIGLLGMQHGDGEILACRAAHAAGIQFTLSTMSICSIEDVADAVQKPFWFQLYVMRDRGFVRDLIARAAAAKCSALMVTMDLTMLGQRHCDVKNGLSVPPEITFANVLDVASKPYWGLSVLRGKRKTFGNLAGHIKGMDSITSLASWVSKQFDPTLNWRDLEWIRELWPGRIIIKGVMDADDARIAAKTGVNALVVSNHGGRQLDGAPSSISALPAIVDAVGGETEVLMDSGIRTGQDVLRALASGARGVLLGRAYIYGLGAAGEAGVTRAIEIIRNELDISMGLTATADVRAVRRDVLA